ncbi:MAG: iron ABC transporter substrate-binding protein, partial [Mesorhizobium sp.]
RHGIDLQLAKRGDDRVDPVPMTEIVKHRKQASELAEKVGFDN